MKILIADDKLYMRRALRLLIEGHEEWDVVNRSRWMASVNRVFEFSQRSSSVEDMS
jgi:hypothetical protein